jgi:cyclomaltodextrinase / maltogenic alpha-amylase / neopullulanase
VPSEFWSAVLPQVREEFGDAWFVGEVIHGDYVAYVERSGLDSITEYELWHAVWSSLDSTNLHKLDWTLRRHAAFVEHFVPMTFLSNHDVTRVASQIRDRRHLSHAVALLGFLPGVPSIYHGDEFGLEGVKQDRPGGDEAIRPELPAERGLFTNPHPELEEIYRRVIGLRRRNPWLVDAVTVVERVTNGHLVVRSRARTGTEVLALALNLTDAPYALPAGATVVASEPASGAGSVAPHGWVVFNP